MAEGRLHVHDDHSSDGSLPRQRNRDRAKGNVPVSAQIGRAEEVGLDFLPLTDHRTFNQHYDPEWRSDRLLLIPGERPRLGVDFDGAVRAVWHDTRSADWRWRMMSAVYARASGWSAGELQRGRGNNTWPATTGGAQRDRTQQIFLLPARP